MSHLIRLSKSVLSQEEADAVSKVILEDGYLGMGKEVREFELDIQNFLNTNREVICVNTGTSALHLALQACGVKSGDEVLTPSLTYVATYQAISATGAKPTSCDIDSETGLIDLADAAKRISLKTKAIVYVHYASNLGDLDELYKFAKRHNLRVIEDAAHSFGCSYKGKKIGSFGDISCFSFDGIKNFTSGEGGAIVTDDLELSRLCKDARLLGIEKDTEKRYSNERSWIFDVQHQGWRYHMSNIMAAIGRVQLKKFSNTFANRRVEIKRMYEDLLKAEKNVRFLRYNSPDEALIVPHIIPILISGSKRDNVGIELNNSNIQFGVHYYPNHLLSKYRVEYPLPHTENIFSEILTLPTHPELKDEDVKYIVNVLLKALNR